MTICFPTMCQPVEIHAGLYRIVLGGFPAEIPFYVLPVSLLVVR